MSISRQFELFGWVIPAMAEVRGSDTIIRGRQRTAYFYRKEAIAWARWYRRFKYDKQRAMFLRLAKRYLELYREQKRRVV